MTAGERLGQADAIERLRNRDVTLFASDAETQSTIANRLGWTTLASRAVDIVPQISEFADNARAEEVSDVVLLGMGGSSLASLVISQIVQPTGPKLHVLDTVSPTTVLETLESLDPAHTLYIVASKSGGTVEPNSLYTIFRAAADTALGVRAAGERFIAVTDPGSSLEALAAAKGFRACFLAPADVGGRFSALSVFGLLPAALTGVDLARFVEHARKAEADAARPLQENGAAELAAWMCDEHAAGADKLTLVTSPQVRSFGLWVEQLVAESLGKQGRGIVPVVELDSTPDYLGADRAVAVLRAVDDIALAEWAEAQRKMRPLVEIVLDDGYDIAAEFVRWEYAVALCGVLLGVNPFDEPNVAEAKAATSGVLDGTITPPKPQYTDDAIALTFAGSMPVPQDNALTLEGALVQALETLGEVDYLALLAYLPDDKALFAPLENVAPVVSAATRRATCLELGPRYLHSTGQLHKGGPDSGVFIIITTSDSADVPIAGQPWTLRTLHRAQAEGDLVALSAHGRRALRIDLEDASLESVQRLADGLADAARVVREHRDRG